MGSLTFGKEAVVNRRSLGVAGGDTAAGQLSRVARFERKLSNAALYQPHRVCCSLCWCPPRIRQRTGALQVTAPVASSRT